MHRISPLFACVLLLVSPAAHALIDTDLDGMGDIWESSHGFHIGPNPPTGQLPSDDSDKDGFSNLSESRAGTNPADAASFPSFLFAFTPPVYEAADPIEGSPAPALIDPPVSILTWLTVPGKTYQPVPSEDLATWSQATSTFFGEGISQTMESETLYPDGSVPPKLFWRVEINDTDSDLDNLTDYEERHIADPNNPAKTLDPNNADTDGDGIPDGIEYTPGTNGLAAFTNTLLTDPDGSGLPASLDADLLGRWDLEATHIAPALGPYYTLARYADSTAAARHIVPFYTETKPDGMPSKAAGNTASAVGFLCPPRTLLHNRTTYSVSLWARIEKDSLTASRPIAALFTHHRRLPKAAPYQAQYKIDINGMWIERLANGTHVLKAGTSAFINYTPGTNQQVNGTWTFNGVTSAAKPAGTLDDGQWHHYLAVRTSGSVTLYLDGEIIGSNSNVVIADINATNETKTGISLGRYYGEPAEDGLPYTDPQAAKASFDRVRVWSRTLTAGDAQSLFKQDADRDGLWDITEERTRRWADHNGNAIAEPGEYAFLAQPLHSDPPQADHDGDDITSLDEQNLTTTDIAKRDTDGDSLPEGYERSHPPLDPKVPNDGSADPDLDGLTTAQEYTGGITNPFVADAQLYPPTWISVERSLRYDYDDYGVSQPSVPKILSTTATWPGSTPTAENLTAIVPFNLLHTALPPRQPFPANFPSNNLSPDLSAGGSAQSIPSPDCYHTSLSQRRIIVKLATPATEPREFKALLLTERSIDGIPQPDQAEDITLTVPAGQSQSSPYDLLPSFLGSGFGGGAYSETVQQSVIHIEIVDAGKKPATELRVAKMEHALNAAGTLTIDDDPDRFHVRIRKAEGMKAVSIKLATVANPDAGYNDDPTEIDLEEDGDWFVSPPLMLVSDDVDDDFSRNGAGQDDARNDRTHKIQLGGKVSVESFTIGGNEHPADVKVPVPAKKKLSGRIIFFGDTNNFENQQKMLEYRRIAMERYAQVGITLDFPITTIAEYPAGVDGKRVNYETGMGNQGKKLVNEDIKALYDKAVAEGKNADITIMVVEDFVNTKVRGSAAVKSGTDPREAAYTGCITLAMGAMTRQNAIFTVAHETGHILTDDYHYGEQYEADAPLHRVTQNLMRESTSSINSIRRSKRLFDVQVGKFRTDLLKNP